GILIGALDIGCTPLDITDDNEEHLPNEFQLLQNYPNPFNPSTVIEFSLPTNSSVKITVYDILGQVIRTIVDERLPAGYHSITWDGKDKDGNVVSTGIYFYKLKANDFTESRKMILMK
ncbi:MAG: FlgD immunoglobulin-like domain containing protein, partial [Candidatus Zixiibacteriota bacterium]